MTILIFLLISYLIMCYGLSLLFAKAGVSKKSAWIPGVNFVEWAKLIGRKPKYVFWYFFPIVNLFIFVGMAMDLMKSFGQNSLKDTIFNFFYAPGYFVYLGMQDNVKYTGPHLTQKKEYFEKIAKAEDSNNAYELKKLRKNNPYKISQGREWLESIVFAVFAAAFIRMFLIEAYTIPTSSMEGSLLVGDYLFVSKVHYGLRTPMTVLQFPLLHNRLPIVGGESYLEKPSLPYFRFPKFTSVKRNDPMVFNWPVGDSVFITPNRSIDIGQVRNNNVLDKFQRQYELITRPMDKTDFYIKRTIGVPGDSLEIINQQVHIDGEAIVNPHDIQFTYNVLYRDNIFNMPELRDQGISPEDIKGKGKGVVSMVLNQDQIDYIKSNYPGTEIKPLISKKNSNENDGRLFPHDPENYPGWTIDNYGPIYIPEAGQTVEINDESIGFYRRIITNYEDNTLEKKNGDYFINGEKTDSYTFKYDYYWMMGDNRHNSEDSRVWGYVPETHVVGKPLFIFFSTKEGSMGNGIRWDRIFSNAYKFEE